MVMVDEMLVVVAAAFITVEQKCYWLSGRSLEVFETLEVYC